MGPNPRDSNRRRPRPSDLDERLRDMEDDEQEREDRRLDERVFRFFQYNTHPVRGVFMVEGSG